MDYGPVIMKSVRDAAKAAGPWQQDAARASQKGVTDRAAAGPIGPRDATAIAETLPSFFVQNFPALDADENPASGPVHLGPVLDKGFKSWYWHLGSVAGTGVVVLLTATAIAVGVVAWTLACGYVNPAPPHEWIQVPPVYLDATQVQTLGNGVTFANEQVTGSITASETGFKLQVTSTAFQYSVVAASARGPTYEQSTGAVEVLGGTFQTGYWSIVDGVVAAGGATLNSVAGSGRAWLDYQQEGLFPLSGAQKFLVGLSTPSAGIGTPWLWAAVQLPGVQMAVRVISASAVAAISAGTPAAALVNVWTVGAAPQYGVQGTVQALAWTGGAPSSIRLVLGSNAYVLTSIASTAAPIPGVAALGGFEAPSTVTVNGAATPTGVGSIEWVTLPQRSAVARSAGMSAEYVSATSKPDAAAVTTITVAAFAAAMLIILPPALVN